MRPVTGPSEASGNAFLIWRKVLVRSRRVPVSVISRTESGALQPPLATNAELPDTFNFDNFLGLTVIFSRGLAIAHRWGDSQSIQVTHDLLAWDQSHRVSRRDFFSARPRWSPWVALMPYCLTWRSRPSKRIVGSPPVRCWTGLGLRKRLPVH
jgi:hypothetical protein